MADLEICREDASGQSSVVSKVEGQRSEVGNQNQSTNEGR
jgi:hypothetical protein